MHRKYAPKGKGYLASGISILFLDVYLVFGVVSNAFPDGNTGKSIWCFFSALLGLGLIVAALKSRVLDPEENEKPLINIVS